MTVDRPHPHNLVGLGCKKGVYTQEINTDDMKMVFSNLGIQCVRKRDIKDALKVREEIRVDPFKSEHQTGLVSVEVYLSICFPFSWLRTSHSALVNRPQRRSALLPGVFGGTDEGKVPHATQASRVQHNFGQEIDV